MVINMKSIQQHFADALSRVRGSDRLFLGGHLEVRLNGGAPSIGPNLITNEGIAYMLDVGILDAVKQTNWAFIPYSASVAPNAAVTAATFNGIYTEVTAYDETTRPVWDGTRAGSVISNSSALSTTTFNGSSINVYGCGISSSVTKSSGSGVLLAIAALPTAKTGLGIGDALSYLYALTGSSGA